jgi:hypothetical protein
MTPLASGAGYGIPYAQNRERFRESLDVILKVRVP